jgi:hypothetical protein
MYSGPVNVTRYFRSLFVNWPFLARVGQFTHERVEYNFFLFDESLKGLKPLKLA